MTATKITISLAVLTIGLVAILVIAGTNLKRAVERLATETAEKETTNAAERSRPTIDRMSLSLQSWGRAEPGSVGLMSLTIVNHNPYGVKDITISCTFHDEKRVQLSQQTQTIHDAIPANSTKEFARVNVGPIQGRSELAECSLRGSLRE